MRLCWRYHLVVLLDHAAVVELADASLERVGHVRDHERAPMPVFRAKKSDAYYARFRTELETAGHAQPPSVDALHDELGFFFWRDSFGRLLRFTRDDLEPPDDCAKKPVTP